jgi:p-cumate 2,3-dioxygenase subunit alpha
MAVDGWPEPVVHDDRQAGLFRLHRSVFTSEEILRLELEHIFRSAWIYVGHESEVPAPNDFVTRRVAGRPVIFSRDRAGQVRVMLNSCRHRGAEVCRLPRGNARVFTCFYHGWAYDGTGRLVSVPDGGSYSAAFDRAGLGLYQPRVESYRGFVFACFGAAALPLPEYLGDARHQIDLLADQAEDGMAVATGQHNYSMQANWKLLMENGVDGQHGITVHQTYFEMMGNLGVSSPTVVGHRTATTGIDLGRGHAMTLTARLGSAFSSDEVERDLAARRAAHVARFGEDYAAMMLDTSRNVNIFPNLVLIDIQFGIQIRTVWPLAPGHTQITGWQLTPADSTDAVRRYRMENSRTFWGPAGLATPDDVEALEQCQRGFEAEREVGWSDLSRAIGDPSEPSELPQRAFWRAWNELMSGVPFEREGPRWDTSYLAGARGA